MSKLLRRGHAPGHLRDAFLEALEADKEFAEAISADSIGWFDEKRQA